MGLPPLRSLDGDLRRPPADCVRCGVDGPGDEAEKLSQLTFEYTGAPGTVRVYDNDKVRARNLLFEGVLSPGDRFTIMASAIGKGRFSSKVGVYLNGTARGDKIAEFHTSCSSPVVPDETTEANQPKGEDPNGRADLLVRSGRDSEGRPLCDGDTPPGSEGCQTVTDDCFTFDLLDVEGQTYRFRLTNNCKRGLSNAAFELPAGVAAASFAASPSATNVENPGGTGGPFNARYRNIKFEFGGDIKNGESVVVSFTLPDGAAYSDDLLRVQAKASRNVYEAAFTPSLCDDDPCPDAGPPTIQYSIVDEGGTSFVEVRVADDTGIESVSFEEAGTDNLEEDLSARSFTPGETAAFFRFRILDRTKDSKLKGRATDVCGTTLCPVSDDNQVPELTQTLVVIDDETGTVQPASAPRPPGVFDRFGRQLDATDAEGIVRYETFARRNTSVFRQPLPGCDADGGCDLDPAQTSVSVVVAVTDTSVPSGGAFGLSVADECNIFVFDPATPGGAARLSGGYVMSCPAGVPEGTVQASTEAVEFGMEQNRPNPVRGQSQVLFSMPEAGTVHLAVYDMLGRTVRVLADGSFEAGHHTVALDASDLPSGTYSYRLATDHGTAVKQMVVVR